MNSKSIYWFNFNCIFLLFVLTKTAFSWNSIGPYTHEKITDDAINAISSLDYPDIYMFAENLRDGSETEAHDPPGDGRNYDVWAPTYTLWWNNQEIGKNPTKSRPG